MNVFHDNPSKMRAVDIIGTEDCHDIHVFYKWMETDHSFTYIQLFTYIYTYNIY